MKNYSCRRRISLGKKQGFQSRFGAVSIHKRYIHESSSLETMVQRGHLRLEKTVFDQLVVRLGTHVNRGKRKINLAANVFHLEGYRCEN